jgi:hypothetical protein
MNKKELKPWGFCETPEEKCTMNYCDENGCQNRKRNKVELIGGKILTMDDLNKMNQEEIATRS